VLFHIRTLVLATPYCRHNQRLVLPLMYVPTHNTANTATIEKRQTQHANTSIGLFQTLQPQTTIVKRGAYSKRNAMLCWYCMPCHRRELAESSHVPKPPTPRLQAILVFSTSPQLELIVRQTGSCRQDGYTNRTIVRCLVLFLNPGLCACPADPLRSSQRVAFLPSKLISSAQLPCKKLV
jgi:hypothetical protein